MINDEQKKIENQSRLIPLIVVSLMAIGFLIYCYSQIQTHYLLSKEAFLGNLYRGNIIPFIQDNDKAIRYLTIAAKNNNEAYCDLGEIYGEKDDYKEAAYIYFLAAMQGSYRCEKHTLSLSYPNDTEKELNKHIKKYADEKKFSSANYIYGRRLIEGIGVEKNINLGVSYLEKAVVQNHVGAKLYLSRIYILGELVPQNLDKANQLLK